MAACRTCDNHIKDGICDECRGRELDEWDKLKRQRDELLRVLRGGLHLLRTPADPVPHDVCVCKCLVCGYKREAFGVIAACEEV
jgi:hypothetical protein